jgi:hypothetical protein
VRIKLHRRRFLPRRPAGEGVLRVLQQFGGEMGAMMIAIREQRLRHRSPADHPLRWSAIAQNSRPAAAQ